MTTIVALGDSTTAGTPGFKSPLEAPPHGAGNAESQYAYWLMETHPDWQVLNRGVDGERSDQIRARFARDVAQAAPDLVVIIAGVNDVYQGRGRRRSSANGDLPGGGRRDRRRRQHHSALPPPPTGRADGPSTTDPRLRGAPRCRMEFATRARSRAGQPDRLVSSDDSSVPDDNHNRGARKHDCHSLARHSIAISWVHDFKRMAGAVALAASVSIAGGAAQRSNRRPAAGREDRPSSQTRIVCSSPVGNAARPHQPDPEEFEIFDNEMQLRQLRRNHTSPSS